MFPENIELGLDGCTCRTGASVHIIFAYRATAYPLNGRAIDYIKKEE